MESRHDKRATQQVTYTTTRSGAGAAAGDVGEGVTVITDDTANDSGISGSSRLSPHRLSLQQAQQQLSHFNDRLKQYVERMCTVETENQRLSLQIQAVTRERNSVRSAFEGELAKVRLLLDETAKEKARFQLEATKFKSMVDDLQATQRKHGEDEAKKLRLENDNLRKALADETLLRVDFENRVLRMRDEQSFQQNLFSRELDEWRRKLQLQTEINEKLEDEYEAKTKRMWDRLDTQIRDNRKEIEHMYQMKISQMQNMADRDREAAATAREDAERLRLQLDVLERDKNKSDGLVQSFEKEIKNLKERLQLLRDDLCNRSREDEIRRLNEEIQRMMQEKQDLMDTQLRVGVEIAVYRSVLEGHDARLHLLPTSPPEAEAEETEAEEAEAEEAEAEEAEAEARSGSSDRRGVKRNRVYQERDTEVYNTYTTTQKAAGDVEISDHDLDGLFVKVHNKSDKEVTMGGWILKSDAGGQEVTYEFDALLILRPGDTITVWSSNAPNVQHSPPSDLVMENQNWPVGDRIRTVLITSEEQETALLESILSSSYYNSFRTAGGDHGLESGDGDQRCLIM